MLHIVICCLSIAKQTNNNETYKKMNAQKMRIFNILNFSLLRG